MGGVGDGVRSPGGTLVVTICGGGNNIKGAAATLGVTTALTAQGVHILIISFSPGRGSLKSTLGLPPLRNGIFRVLNDRGPSPHRMVAACEFGRPELERK